MRVALLSSLCLISSREHVPRRFTALICSQESALFAEEDTFLLGRDILVRPVFEEGAKEATFVLPGTEVRTAACSCNHSGSSL